MSQINKLFLIVFLAYIVAFLTIRQISKLERQVFDLQERIEILEKK